MGCEVVMLFIVYFSISSLSHLVFVFCLRFSTRTVELSHNKGVEGGTPFSNVTFDVDACALMARIDIIQILRSIGTLCEHEHTYMINVTM